MVVQSADQACDNARRQTFCIPGTCLMQTRGWLDIPSGAWDAITAWWDCEPEFRHPGKRGPKGAPQIWSGGSEDHGHADLSLGRGRDRTTDAPTSGHVSTQPHSYPSKVWGHHYMGWLGKLNGVIIPYLNVDWREHGDVYVSKLHLGQTRSDSVARLRYRLQYHPEMPATHRPGFGNGYGEETLEAVRYWQRHIMPHQIDGPTDGKRMSNRQANQLFGPAYEVIEVRR